MDEYWRLMYLKAKSVQINRSISDIVKVGSVSAAVLSNNYEVYTGICVDTNCSLGICAERNAIFNMLTEGGSFVRRLLILMPNGSFGFPCGACSEVIRQLNPKFYNQVELITSLFSDGVVTLMR